MMVTLWAVLAGILFVACCYLLSLVVKLARHAQRVHELIEHTAKNIRSAAEKSDDGP